MSTISTSTNRLTVKDFQKMKIKNEKISALTAYDYSMATVLDQAGIDLLLVGDSAANVCAGFDTTLPITLDQMIYHAGSVVRGSSRAFVAVDMPFGSYQGSSKKALKSAIKIIKESGAHAVKMEGGPEIADSIRSVVSAGIPVLGHLGLTPQSIHALGSYGVQGKDDTAALKLKEDCECIQDAGCFGIVLEKIPASLASAITEKLVIPTIAIGAGNSCDGQILVSYDMLGLNKGFNPKFLRRYAQIYDEIFSAAEAYIRDVRSMEFPNSNEQY